MLNKLKFNNLVISNKKGIQQARLQTINKLVHKIRKLKTLLEKRPNDDKCKGRIRKSTESMELLKKFKRVEIMKHVLLLEKPPAAVITNGLSAPEEIAVALMAMNKIMQGLIKRFKTELELFDSDDRIWRKELTENSKRKQKMERTEQKRLKRKVIKEQKVKEHKRKEWLEQNCANDDNTATTLDEEANISTVGDWKVEEIDPETLKEDEQTIHIKPEETTIKNKKLVSRTNKTKIMPNTEKPKQEKSTKPMTNMKTKIKIKNESKTDQMSEPQTLAGRISPEQNLIASENEDTDSETFVEDPFFLTDTGENYLSTAVIKSSKTEQDHNNDNQKDLQIVKLDGSKKYTHLHERKQDHDGRRSQQKRKTFDQNDERGTRQQTGDRHQKTHNEKKTPWQTRNDNNSKLTNQSAPQFLNNDKVKLKLPAEKLHPSWAAKQKLKPVITSFQGKRIKFDEDGTSKESANKTSHLSNVKFGKKYTPASPLENTDHLHPSWAAKKKHKPIIASFQGKKITFDDD